MPNFVNEILFSELKERVENAGSCLVVSFDKLTVKKDEAFRGQLREMGLDYHVVKNRLATLAFKAALDVDLGDALRGKCGVIFAPEEKAIAAAKLIRDQRKKDKEAGIDVAGGVIEGEAIVGAAAQTIADMPDRNTVNAQLAGVLIAPARQMASMLAAIGGGLARVIQAKIDKEEGAGEG
jgi:large subunit ribosomal protein L10